MLVVPQAPALGISAVVLVAILNSTTAADMCNFISEDRKEDICINVRNYNGKGTNNGEILESNYLLDYVKAYTHRARRAIYI